LSLINNDYKDVHVVVLTMHDEIAYANRAFDLGASAYLVKDDAEEQLDTCLRSVQQGERYCSIGEAEGDSELEEAHLSDAERNIFNLVSTGKSSCEIASLLSVSVRTVDNHRGNIARKLGLRGTNALLKYAIKKGSASS